LPKDQHVPDYDITLGIDSSRLPKTQSKNIKGIILYKYFSKLV